MWQAKSNDSLWSCAYPYDALDRMDVVNGQSWSYDANGNVQRSPASGGGTYTYVPGTNILAALGTGEHFSANPQGSVTEIVTTWRK